MQSSIRSMVVAYDRVKRAGDVLGAGAALVVLSPIVLGTALLVRVKLGRPVLFRQERPGRHGRTFEILKFRSMLEPEPARGRVTNEERMTTFGERLRGTSLDELPGLLNVLRGEMSLVGPRPLRTKYLERYSEEQARRHDVRPGLTGLAQVSGRNNISWDDRFELDLQYVRTRSLLTDLRILFATVPKVFRREGVAEDGQATMSEFFGPRRSGHYWIRSASADSGQGPWEVVDIRTGLVVACCELERAEAGGQAITIQIDAGLEEPDMVMARAEELARGIAREYGTDTVRQPTSGLGSARAEQPASLGLRAASGAEMPGSGDTVQSTVVDPASFREGDESDDCRFKETVGDAGFGAARDVAARWERSDGSGSSGLKEDVVDGEKVREVIWGWMVSYLAQVHEQMPRPGSVCPFVKPALDAGSIEIRTVSVAGLHSLAILREEVRCALVEWAVAATAHRATAHGALVIAVPDLLERGHVIDEVHAAVKDEAVEAGLMIGQFHGDCAEPSARNPLFAVNRSPVPLLAIRTMTVHDILFLHGNPEWFRAYKRRFGHLYGGDRRIDPSFVALFKQATARWAEPIAERLDPVLMPSDGGSSR